ncbi:PUA domain-containing protein [Candidatus Lokiarchaeum ossiferum]|uniref:PUA domain-containing protein n=1 Tax=Candidatus Lokiarchaeum ossiferum TaxID=2951803 RepID=UPI00352C5A76
MKMQSLSKAQLFHVLHQIFCYQFSENIADLFLEPFEDMVIKFSRRTGKVKQIFYQGDLQSTYRSPFGTFSLTLYAALRILKKIPSPNNRIQVQHDVADFIRQGKSVFSQHVELLDKNLQIGDEVFVVDESDELLAIGKLNAPVNLILSSNSGCAVKVRKGVNSIKLKN